MCRHVIFTGNSDASTVVTSFDPEVVDPSPRKLHSVEFPRGSSYLPNLVTVALMWAEVAEERYYILLPVRVILRPLRYSHFGDFSKSPNCAIFKITVSCPEFFALSNGTNVTIGTFYVTFGPFQHAVGGRGCIMRSGHGSTTHVSSVWQARLRYCPYLSCEVDWLKQTADRMSTTHCGANLHKQRHCSTMGQTW